MKILLLEDEKDLAQTGRDQLELLGHEVITAYDIAEAREVLADRSQHVHIVIADHRLPDGLGIDFVVDLREQVPEAVFTIVSGCLTDRDVDRLENLGIPYFMKPLLYSKVVADICKEMLNKRPVRTQAAEEPAGQDKAGRKRKPAESAAPPQDPPLQEETQKPLQDSPPWEPAQESPQDTLPRPADPVVLDPVVEARNDETVAEPSDNVRPRTSISRLRILLLEDEEELAELAKEELELSGHEVALAFDIASARAYLDKEGAKVQVLIADHSLPDGHGIDFVGEMRALYPDISYAIVSGVLTDADIARLDIYELPHFRKPITYGEVLAEIRRDRLDRPGPAKEPMLKGSLGGSAETAEPAGAGEPRSGDVEAKKPEPKIPFWKRLFGGRK
jgi:DNA-binding response OmpR family regulator